MDHRQMQNQQRDHPARESTEVLEVLQLLGMVMRAIIAQTANSLLLLRSRAERQTSAPRARRACQHKLHSRISTVQARCRSGEPSKLNLAGHMCSASVIGSVSAYGPHHTQSAIIPFSQSHASFLQHRAFQLAQRQLPKPSRPLKP